eukprot:TRINITY_DN20916_c0_g1_i1.p1 TRINITY_DN20916_c0_g1~~TRINITY_DN20916_c0_g1_i1.p1  ORF type:complete len:461 (+),score=50.12 TRINITY_DN20916_c0_g1_i1:140-1522(+)
MRFVSVLIALAIASALDADQPTFIWADGNGTHLGFSNSTVLLAEVPIVAELARLKQELADLSVSCCECTKLISKFDTTKQFVQQQRLRPPDADSNDGFGNGLAAQHDVLVAGAYLQGTSNQGAVYIYQRNSTTQYSMERVTLVERVSFGSAVAVHAGIQETTIIAASPGTSEAFGHVDMFVRRLPGAVLPVTKAGLESQEYDHYGTAIVLSDDGQWLAVGASTAKEGTTPEVGAVDIYSQSPTSSGFDHVRRVHSNTATTGVEFGASLAMAGLDGSILAVGAPGRIAASAGYVEIFARTVDGVGVSYEYIQHLSPKDNSSFEAGFGTSISASNVILVVSEAVFGGPLHVYERTHHPDFSVLVYLLVQQLYPPRQTSFGSIALYGSKLAAVTKQDTRHLLDVWTQESTGFFVHTDIVATFRDDDGNLLNGVEIDQVALTSDTLYASARESNTDVGYVYVFE